MPRTIEDILADMTAITEAAQERDLTADEITRVGDLEGELAAKRASEETLARVAAYQAPTKSIVAARPSISAPADDERDLERAFDHYLRTGIPNQDIAELRVRGGDLQYRAQGEGTGSAGGYLVPEGFRMKMVERLKAFGGFAQNVEELVTTTGNTIDFPTVDDTGNIGEIVAEGGTFASGADVTFGTKALGAYRYAAGGAGNTAVKVSVELLQDSAFDIAGYLTRALATRIGRVQATHWLTGTGSSQPQGLLTPKSVEASIASTTTPTYAELVGLLHSVDPMYRANAKWCMNDTTLGVIRGMVDGNSRPLWLPEAQSGMMDAPGGTLLGYPVIIDQAMPDIASSGSTKFLAFGDFMQAYVIRRVKDIQMVVLNELYANNGQVGFMAWARADGLVQDANAYAVLGSHT